MIETIFGSVIDNRKVVLLKDICDQEGIQTGPFGSLLHQKDYLTEGTPIITVEHLGENRIIDQDLPCVSEEDKIRLSRFIMNTGDIIFSRVGSVDRRSLVREQENGWLFSGRCLRVSPNQKIVDPRYLSWFFGLGSFKDYVRKIAVGATMPSLNTELLSNIPIILPPLPEQRAIADVLSALDDKIELNRRMNQTLEELAQTIFKHMFIDNPEREKWEIRNIGEVCSFEYGKALKDTNRIQGKIPVFGSNGQIGLHNEFLVKGPGIVVGRKGNPGIVIYVHTDFYPIDTTFYVVPKSEIDLYWLYFSLYNLNLPNLSSDSAVPGLNRNIAYMTDLRIPPIPLTESFQDQVKIMLEKIDANNKENRILAELRDTLLPKLMSGQVRVSPV